MIIKPRVRGFMCITTHPVGCETNVKNQIDFIKAQSPIDSPKRVLVIGSSTGYGLAARIGAAFGVAVPLHWVSSLKSRAQRPSLALLAGITLRPSTSMQSRMACMRKALMAMPSPMRLKPRLSKLLSRTWGR